MILHAICILIQVAIKKRGDIPLQQMKEHTEVQPEETSQPQELMNTTQTAPLSELQDSQELEEAVESRSAYQKRKRDEAKQQKRKKRRMTMAVVGVLVVLAGVLCGTLLSGKMNTPHDAIVIASANVQYVKHTVTDTVKELLEKLPWGETQPPDDSQVAPPIDNPPSSDEVGEPETVEPPEEPGEADAEGSDALVTPDNPFGIDPSKPMVALTFDDGPSKYTWPIVTALYEHNARATFFLVGERIASHQAAIDFTLANHNEIASHSYDHANLVELTEEEILSQIQKVDNLMQKQHDYTPVLFRVPFGNRDENVLGVLRQQGKPVIGWSVDPRDWELQDKDAVVKHVLSHVKDGDIILLHDIHQPTAEAVAELVPALQERGYQLVTVSELLQYKGIEATPGTYYYASWKWV